LNNHNSSQGLDEAGCLSGLARLVRQICLLREQGDAAEAGRLQQAELAVAVGEFRRAHGSDALPEEKLAALFAAEADRVAEALLTAELLIKRLTAIWPAAPAAAAVAREPAVAAPRTPARPAPSQPPVISELLDAMLAAERTSTRLSPARNS